MRQRGMVSEGGNTHRHHNVRIIEDDPGEYVGHKLLNTASEQEGKDGLNNNSSINNENA